LTQGTCRTEGLTGGDEAEHRGVLAAVRSRALPLLALRGQPQQQFDRHDLDRNESHGRRQLGSHERIVASGLGMKGVDDFKKRKSVEIRIPSTDPADSVLAHQDGCMRVMKQIA
jgi:hypothetical protein